MGQESGRILLEAIGEKQRQTARGQHLQDTMNQSLRHRERALSDIKGQEQLADGVNGDPDPVGRAREGLAGLGFALLPCLLTDHDEQLI